MELGGCGLGVKGCGLAVREDRDLAVKKSAMRK